MFVCFLMIAWLDRDTSHIIFHFNIHFLLQELFHLSQLF